MTELQPAVPVTLEWNEQRHNAHSSTHTARSGGRLYVIGEWPHYATLHAYNANGELSGSFDNFPTVTEAKAVAEKWSAHRAAMEKEGSQ